jgi:hypothetical protein
VKLLWIILALLGQQALASPLIGSFMGQSRPQYGGRDVRNILPEYSAQLRAYYRTDGNYQDVSGNALHATARGSTSLTAGKFGEAASFNGTTDYLDFSSTILSAATNVSVSAWFKTSNTTSQMALFGTGVTTGCNPSRSEVFLKAGTVAAAVGCASWLTGSTSYTANTWQHLVYVVASSKQVTLYLNGAKIAGPTDISWGQSLAAGNEMIGAGWNGNVRESFFNGQLDDVAVWQGVSLTDAEVMRLYGGTQSTQLLSRDQPASQSSTSTSASAGNDGNLANSAHTNSEANPWWQVDLGFVRSVTRVDVYNRSDRGCPAHADCPRVSNFDIYVSDDATRWTAVGYFAGTAGYPSAVTVNASGRYVRVRTRNTDFFDPAEIEVYGPAYALPSVSDLALQFDASRTAQLWQTSDKAAQVAGNGDPVGAWTASNTALDVLQATAGLRASLVSPGLNGMPVVRFSGTSGASLVSAATVSVTAANTIFVVAKDRGTTADNGGIFSHWGCIGIISNAATSFLTDGCGGLGASTTQAIGQFRVVTASYSQASTTGTSVYVDGALKQYKSSAGVTTSPGSNNVELGGRTFSGWSARVFTGDIAEVLVYNRLLSATERASIEQYLAAKWGL